jgi:hypothetical protein
MDSQVATALVDALRLPPLRKEAWTQLKNAHPTIPAADATKEDEALKQLIAIETWCDQEGIAIAGSRLVLPPPKGAAPGKTGPGAGGK